MASSVNLLTAVRELEAAGMTQFRKQYSDVIDILGIIDKGSHDSGPLKLAVDQGLITLAEVQEVMSLKQYAGVENFDIDDTDISDNLKKIYKDRTAKDPARAVPLNHMVSSIAYKVVNYINMNTNFLRRQLIFSTTQHLCKCTLLPKRPRRVYHSRVQHSMAQQVVY